MTCGIYKITNKINGHSYIGQSINVEKRWREHRFPSTYRNSQKTSEYNNPLYRAFRKYGLDNFTFSIVEECQEDELNNREKYWIDFYHTHSKNGYNRTAGAEKQDGFGRGEEHPRAKLSQAEVDDIINMLSEGKNTKQIQSKYPNVTMGEISSINNGYTWRKSDINYPISRMNGAIKVKDDDVLNIRRKFYNGVPSKELAQEYGVHSGTILEICKGITHKNVIIFPYSKTEYGLFEGNRDLYEILLKSTKEYFYHGADIKQLFIKYKVDSYESSFDLFRHKIYAAIKNFFVIWYQNKTAREIRNIYREHRIIYLREVGYHYKDIIKDIGCSERTYYRLLEKISS